MAKKAKKKNVDPLKELRRQLDYTNESIAFSRLRAHLIRLGVRAYLLEEEDPQLDLPEDWDEFPNLNLAIRILEEAQDEYGEAHNLQEIADGLQDKISELEPLEPLELESDRECGGDSETV